MLFYFIFHLYAQIFFKWNKIANSSFACLYKNFEHSIKTFFYFKGSEFCGWVNRGEFWIGSIGVRDLYEPFNRRKKHKLEAHPPVPLNLFSSRTPQNFVNSFRPSRNHFELTCAAPSPFGMFEDALQFAFFNSINLIQASFNHRMKEWLPLFTVPLPFDLLEEAKQLAQPREKWMNQINLFLMN